MRDKLRVLVGRVVAELLRISGVKRPLDDGTRVRRTEVGRQRHGDRVLLPLITHVRGPDRHLTLFNLTGICRRALPPSSSIRRHSVSQVSRSAAEKRMMWV